MRVSWRLTLLVSATLFFVSYGDEDEEEVFRPRAREPTAEEENEVKMKAKLPPREAFSVSRYVKEVRSKYCIIRFGVVT